MTGLRLSVALCTYRGQRHLPRQLASLIDQRRAPDEVVVSDDASTDGTLEILERFARQAPFPVEVRVNERRLGSTANFDRTFELCGGDVILPCDQDDEWDAAKLAAIERAFADRPEVGLAFSEAALIDERSEDLDTRLWETLEAPPSQWRRFRRGGAGGRVEVLCQRNLVTGATMAFRAGFRDLVLPIPPEWVQDGWIALLVAAVADVAAIPEPLVRYRVHGDQQIGAHVSGRWERIRRRMDVPARMRSDQQSFADQAREFGEAHARLEDARGLFAVPDEALDVLDAKVRHARARAHVGRTCGGRLRTVAGELRSGRYHRFSSGLASAAKDLLLPDAR